MREGMAYMRSLSSAGAEEGDSSFSEELWASVMLLSTPVPWPVDGKLELRQEMMRQEMMNIGYKPQLHAFGYLMGVVLILFQNDCHTGSCNK